MTSCSTVEHVGKSGHHFVTLSATIANIMTHLVLGGSNGGVYQAYTMVASYVRSGGKSYPACTKVAGSATCLVNTRRIRGSFRMFGQGVRLTRRAQRLPS